MKKGTGARGVKGITEGEEAEEDRKERVLVIGKVGKGGEVTRLVYLANKRIRSRTANKMPYLVNVPLLLCKAEALDIVVFAASRKGVLSV